MLRDAGLPPPEVGVELLDASGEVLPEMDLVWRSARIGVVEAAEPTELEPFHEMGWTVLTGLDEAVVGELVQAMMSNRQREGANR